MKTPSADDLATAARWLQIDKNAEDYEACLRVSEWLETKADMVYLAALCRKAGCSVNDPLKWEKIDEYTKSQKVYQR